MFYYVDPPFGLRRHPMNLWSGLKLRIISLGADRLVIHCLPAILGCSYYLEGSSNFRLSEACRPVLKEFTARWPGRVVDLSFLGAIASSATGLGFGIAIVSAATSELIQISDSVLLQLCVITLATMLITFSVYRGLERGILVLSTVNVFLALLFIGSVFLLGPSTYLEMGLVF